MCLNETCSKIRISKNLSGAFPIQNGPHQGDALFPLLFNCALANAIRKVHEYQELIGKYHHLAYQRLVGRLDYK
jgi:hypothetical protein